MCCGVARHLVGQRARGAGGVLHVLLRHARQLDLGVGRQARDVLLVGAQLVRRGLRARRGGAQQLGLAVRAQHLLARQRRFLQHRLHQLDVQVAHLLERCEQRLRHSVQECGLRIDVGFHCWSNRLWKWIHG
jgi:hypothetical protein